MKRTTALLVTFVLLVAASLTVASGCASSGKVFAIENIKLIEDGVTTRSQVFEYFGAPANQSRYFGDRGPELVWEYSYLPAHGQGAKLTVYFDTRDVVKSHKYVLILQQ